jgi:hypothetical protein
MAVGGNICFISATLQLVGRIPEFDSILSTLTSLKSQNETYQGKTKKTGIANDNLLDNFDPCGVEHYN